jgi:hydroxymethylbilane synthase
VRSKLILATRGSPLALAQANLVKGELEKHWSGLVVELLKIKTSGDLILDRPLRTVGGKGLFVKEIEEALQKKKADIAVHSMKDVPALLPEGLKVGVILKREDPSDVLISRDSKKMSELKAKSVIGTSSLRRKIQLERMRSDLVVKDLRGNVETRLRKLKNKEYDAIILALAGLKRLGLESEVSEVLPFICAPGQGAIGIEYPEGDLELEKLLKVLHDDLTEACVKAERVVLKRLEGGCELPLGAQATLISDKLHLKAFIATPDGKKFIQDEVAGDLALAEDLGEKLCEILMSRGAGEIVEEIKLCPPLLG